MHFLLDRFGLVTIRVNLSHQFLNQTNLNVRIKPFNEPTFPRSTQTQTHFVYKNNNTIVISFYLFRFISTQTK